MDMKNKVAIILRTKDRPLFLKRAIQSILGQTYKNYHVYVVNDGGDAETLERVFEPLSKGEREKFSLIHLPVSTKRGGALSIGVNSSSEDYIHIHDDDDMLEPEFLEKTVAYLEQDQEKFFSGVITSNYDVYEKIIDQDIIEVNRTDKNGRREGGILDYSLYLARIVAIVPIAFVFRREAIKFVGPVNPNLEYLEDNEFFLRLMQYGDIGIINEFLCSYHWKMLSEHDGKFTAANQEECNYSSERYTNNLIREAVAGKGTLRTLQAEALKDKTVNEYTRNQLLQELSVLNNSFLNMLNAFNNLINRINRS